jgi:hypothetical protein
MLCFLDGSSELAVIEVGRKGHKALTGKPLAQGFEEGIQSPPRMEYQDARALAGLRQSKMAVWLNNCHVYHIT